MNRCFSFSLFMLLGIVGLSCAGRSSQGPMLPDSPAGAAGVNRQRSTWGVWTIEIDTETWVATAIPQRGPQYTVDVVQFMQKPSGNPANLTIQVTDITQWLTQGRIGVDVGLKHPFPGLDKFTGFDVMGVFMAPGSAQGKYDSDVRYTTGIDEPVLLNADGYTRWMNPVEFPSNGTIFKFKPGKLGNPDAALFTSTINGYKYYADGFAKSDSATSFFASAGNANKRGSFGSGVENHRQFDLKFPLVGGSPKLVFQYAVVASWVEPDNTLSGDPTKLDVPGDFPLSANASEAILLSVVDDSTLFYSGGSGGGNIDLALQVYGWGALKPSGNLANEIYKIVVEGDSSVIPGGFAQFDHAALVSGASPGTSGISSVFQVEIANCTPQSSSPVPLLITVESESATGFDPGDGHQANAARLASYFMTSAAVGGGSTGDLKVMDPNGGETLWMAMSHEIKWDPGTGGIANVKIEWLTDNFASDINTVVASTPNDGSYVWKPIPVVATATAKVRVSAVGGSSSDTSDNNFTIALPVWLDLKAEMTISSSNVNWNEGPVGFPASAERFSPAITQNTDSSVYISFYYWTYGIMTFDSYFGSSDGVNWAGSTGYFNTSTSTLNINSRADCNKAAPTTDGHTVEGIAFYIPGINFWWAGQYPKSSGWAGNFWVGDGLQADFGNGKFAEMGTDEAGYAYFFADNIVNNAIYVRKTLQPGLVCYNSDCTQLEPGSQQITNNGLVSHSRSYARQGSGLALAYYTASGKVMLAETTNPPTNSTWDATEIVWDGTGYSGVNSATLCTDSTGRLFAAWTAQRTSDSKYVILASMRATPSGSWTTPAEAVESSTKYSDVHISSKSVLLPGGITSDVAVVVWENGGTTSAALSPLDLMAFLPKQDVSTSGVTTQDPDAMALGGTYPFGAIFAYSWLKTPGSNPDWEIAIRHATFKTP